MLEVQIQKTVSEMVNVELPFCFIKKESGVTMYCKVDDENLTVIQERLEGGVEYAMYIRENNPAETIAQNYDTKSELALVEFYQAKSRAALFVSQGVEPFSDYVKMKEIVSRVETMRSTQMEYFKSRSKTVLAESKSIEKEIDKLIIDFNNPQETLFDK